MDSYWSLGWCSLSILEPGSYHTCTKVPCGCSTVVALTSWKRFHRLRPNTPDLVPEEDSKNDCNERLWEQVLLFSWKEQKEASRGEEDGSVRWDKYGNVFAESIVCSFLSFLLLKGRSTFTLPRASCWVQIRELLFFFILEFFPQPFPLCF